jgi:hypothetical protein
MSIDELISGGGGCGSIEPGLAGELVTARFGMSENLVNEYDSASESALDALASGDFSIPLENLDLTCDEVAPNIGDAPIPDQVEAYQSQADTVAFPDLTALRASLGLVEVTLDQVTLPPLEAISPTISIPDAPDDALPDVPADAPNVSDPTLPTAPTLDMPAVPVLEDTPIPAAPIIDSLHFEGMMPVWDEQVPEPMFVYSEATYSSDVADAVRTKLYNDVTLGGTGLGADIEDDIWNRALSRINVELDKVYTQALNEWETWNMDMPDGVLSSRLQEIAFEDARNKLDVNRDISIEQARLAQQNTQFAITSGLVHEKQLMDYTNQVNQRAFEVAKYRVNAVIDAFNLKVNEYNVRLDGYKTMAAVFRDRIQAELAKVEIYRAQMEGAKIHGELQAQKVEIYTRRVQALQTLIDLYRAQMEGARLQVDVDKTKIDAFRARLAAITTQIGAVTAKYNLYQAQISGESAKVDLYGRQVSAHATQMQGAKIEADINLAEAQAAIEANKNKVAVLEAAINKYKSDTQYELGKDEVGAKVYAARVGGYEAEVGRESSYLSAKVDKYKAQVTHCAAQAELIIKEMEANLQAAAAAKEIQMEALKGAANIQTQKVASALTSVSASAQLGYNASESASCTYANSTSYVTSQAADYRENHNYNYSS